MKSSLLINEPDTDIGLDRAGKVQLHIEKLNRRAGSAYGHS